MPFSKIIGILYHVGREKSISKFLLYQIIGTPGQTRTDIPSRVKAALEPLSYRGLKLKRNIIKDDAIIFYATILWHWSSFGVF
jgi:hypothetical protein